MNDFKSKMNEKIKEYSNDKYLAGYIKNEYTTNDNDIDIYLKIDDKNQLFDGRTVGNQIDLNEGVYQFLEKKTAMLENDVPINLHIIGYIFTPKEQEKIKHLFKEHYSIELYKAQRDYKKTRNKSINLIVIGILFLVIYLYMVLVINFNVLSEIFVFLFSFSLWEAFHSLIYTLNEESNRREAVTQNLLTNIDFIDKNSFDK